MVHSLIADLVVSVPMASLNRSASDDWAVDCRTIEQDHHPYFHLSVRHRREASRTRILLATDNWRRMARVDAATRRLLCEVDSDTFGALMQLA